jgi:hypothetical protein
MKVALDTNVIVSALINSLALKGGILNPSLRINTNGIPAKILALIPIGIKFADETDKKFYEVYKSGMAQ